MSNILNKFISFSKNLKVFYLNRASEIMEKDTKNQLPTTTLTLHRKEDTRYRQRKMFRETNANKESIYHLEKVKKYALLLGYCGVDYYGMQRNHGIKTIEEDLLRALFEAKYINENEYQNADLLYFQRSSRTDKNVSAARQIVSLKLPIDIDVEEINRKLPECIRVFGVKRTTKLFNSKSECDFRSYSYAMPSYTLDKNYHNSRDGKNYRISSDLLHKINDILSIFKDYKNYHNFTIKKHYSDPSSKRYMLYFKVDKVIIKSEMEFVVLVVKGQSFMMHQIRKMVGLAVAIIREHAAYSIMNQAFGYNDIGIPKAPGLGLLLEKQHFDRYDRKFRNTHDAVSWDDKDDLVEEFKNEKIYPLIVQGEMVGNSMGIWLEYLKQHTYAPNEDD